MRDIPRNEMRLQRWKLDQLEEMCVGPYFPNQEFMMQREYLDIYNFEFLEWKLPLNKNHPKYERDLSLVNFYLSLMEGSDETIKNTFMQKISPKEVENYIKNLLCLLASGWNPRENLREIIFKRSRHRKSPETDLSVANPDRSTPSPRKDTSAGN